MKVLVVDDEMVSRKKMMKIMSDLGPCEGVKNGKAALSAVQQSIEETAFYQLITLDVSMPDISGVDVLNKIREIEAQKNVEESQKVKILMVTSHSDVDTVKACRGKCDGYVVKPFNKEVLMEKLKKISLM